MSTILEQLKAKANAAAATAEDMNEAVSGGGGGRLVPAGQYVGRIVEYVDLGLQPQEYQGKPKDPAPEIRLGICLFYSNPEKPGDPDPYVIRPRELAISRNEKATAFKAFAAMNYKRDPNIKHFAQFIGEPFLFHIDVKTGKESKRQYNVVVWDKTAPAIHPVTKQPYDVPQAPDELYRIFLWDNPTKEDWDSLYIEGEREDGTSKNFVQEKILAALNYQGSPLQLLLEGGGGLVAPVQAAQAPQAAAPVVPPAAPAAAAPVAPAAAPEVPAAPLAQPAAAPAVAAPGQATGAAQPPVTGSQVPSVPTATTSPSEAPVAPVAPAAPALPVIPGQPA